MLMSICLNIRFVEFNFYGCCYPLAVLLVLEQNCTNSNPPPRKKKQEHTLAQRYMYVWVENYMYITTCQFNSVHHCTARFMELKTEQMPRILLHPLTLTDNQPFVFTTFLNRSN